MADILIESNLGWLSQVHKMDNALAPEATAELPVEKKWKEIRDLDSDLKMYM